MTVAPFRLIVREQGPSAPPAPTLTIRPSRITTEDATEFFASIVRKRPLTRCRSRDPSQTEAAPAANAALPNSVLPAATEAAPIALLMNLRREKSPPVRSRLVMVFSSAMIDASIGAFARPHNL